MTETTRRRFLQYGVATGAVLAAPVVRRGLAAAVTDSRPRLAGGLRKFREALPVPGNGIVVATPSGTNRYSFTQREIRRALHPDLPPTPVWAYDDGSGLAGLPEEARDPKGVPGGISPEPFATGPMEPPTPDERGFKDTVKVNPGYFTTIRAKFDLPRGVTGPQSYVHHCHIVEHEDNEMMRPFTVMPLPGTKVPGLACLGPCHCQAVQPKLEL